MTQNDTPLPPRPAQQTDQPVSTGAQVETLRGFRRVRRGFWALLALALLLALLGPLALLQVTAAQPLSAHACLWPAVPHANSPAWLVVVPTNGRDSADVEGPWAHAVVQWDMVSMAMGAQRVSAPGAEGHTSAFILPLRLTMAGQWRAQVGLYTAGRSAWHTTLTFTAATASLIPSAHTAPTTAHVCGVTLAPPSGASSASSACAGTASRLPDSAATWRTPGAGLSMEAPT